MVHNGGFLYIMRRPTWLVSHLINCESACSCLLHYMSPVSDIVPDASLEGVTIMSPESSLISDLHLPAKTHRHLFSVSQRKISSPLTGAASFFLHCQNVLNTAGSCLISCQRRAPLQMPCRPGARFGAWVCKLWHVCVKNFFDMKWLASARSSSPHAAWVVTFWKANDSSGMMSSHSMISFFPFWSLISCPHSAVSQGDSCWRTRYICKHTAQCNFFYTTVILFTG